MGTDQESKEPEALKALLQEHASARSEIILHLQLYKTQERNGAILIPLAGLLVPLLIGKGSLSVTTMGASVAMNLTHWAELVILFAVSTVALFLAYSVLAVQFSIQVLGARCVRLEAEINRILDGQVFVWERLAHQIWSNESKIVLKMPDTIVPVLSSLLVIVFGVALPFVATAGILCQKHDALLATMIGAYVWYVSAIALYGIYITFYVTSPALRIDCLQIFQHTIEAGSPLKISSGRRVAVVTAMVAAGLAWFFVQLVPSPDRCAYLGTSNSAKIQPVS